MGDCDLRRLADGPGAQFRLIRRTPPAGAGLDDWETVAAELVAGFRASLSRSAGDERALELVAELSAGDEYIRELWARHDVEALVDRPPVRLDHPAVGELTLTRDNVAVDAWTGLRLVIHHAEPGSPSFAKLKLLAGESPGVRAPPAPGIQWPAPEAPFGQEDR